jgi:hypothetical protein
LVDLVSTLPLHYWALIVGDDRTKGTTQVSTRVLPCKIRHKQYDVYTQYDVRILQGGASKQVKTLRALRLAKMLRILRIGER